MSLRLVLALLALTLAGCETLTKEQIEARDRMLAAIQNEPRGNYFVGRRFYKVDYKMWGWVRKPGQPWKDSQLVMLNEQRTLAPDRAGGKLGTDNDYEYRLEGYFSGDKVYEPASNKVYPEFVLTGYSIRDINPPPIFSDKRSTNPKIRLLSAPAW